MWSHRILVGLAITAAMGLPALAATPPKPAMEVSAAQKHVTFPVSLGENGGFNIDGFAKGAMTMTVPLGWTVTMKVTNVSDLPHSLEVAATEKKIPIEALPPAFKGAETPDLKSGMAPHAVSSFTFKADKAGRYWVMCGVPGHAEGGMWDWLVVSKSASQPKVATGSSTAP